MTTRTDVLAGVTATAAFGMMACMGLGLADTDGPEPWLAGALALGLVIPSLSIRLDPARSVPGPAAVAAALRGAWGRRANAWGLIAVGLFIPHLALWLTLGLRFWPLGLMVAAAAFAQALCAAMVYASERSVPRWSGPPTVPFLLVQAAAAGLLGLAAVEGLLGFPPSLVLWKAAMALIGLTLMGQLWEGIAADTPEGTPVRRDALAEGGRARARLLFRGAVGCGIALPFALALLADAQTERVLLPLAFLLHLAGLAMHRLLFLSLAQEVRAQ